ncbi:hypothetical protein ES705_44649 [subsurface metagenome]
MNTSKRRYDGKHRVTRVFLDDYLVIKGWSRQAGISMAEALHKLITQQPLPKPEPVAVARRAPVFSLTAPVALRHKAPVSIATNGSKAAAFRIKTKGVRYD